MKVFCIKCEETFEFEEGADLDEAPCPSCGNWYSLIEEEAP
jgi:DNA-directed RNA polymerase subunit RPC12/RpoP